MPTRKQDAPRKTGTVGDYKAQLRSVLEQRPSGTRKRLAEALDKNRSFVSQFSNPAYKTPIPSNHLDTIFEVCHFSESEKARFLEAYRAAHPRWTDRPERHLSMRRITLEVPDMGQSRYNRELEQLLTEFTKRAARLIEKAVKKPV